MIPGAGRPEIAINPALRILKAEDTLCGCVITGTDKVRSGYGNGDCLLFDFKHRVFAVADGTERFPWASRDLLLRLADCLDRNGSPDTAAEWRDLIHREVYAAQKFQHKTTFSCAALHGGGDGTGMVIAHGGDCAVMIVDSATGAVSFQTGRDMNFAGRSRVIDDVSLHRLTGRGLRVVMATDGFNDLVKFCVSRSLFSGAEEVFAAWPVDRICERIHGVLDEFRGGFEYDDIGLLAFDPFRTADIGPEKILIGGTRPHEETRFRRDPGAGSNGRWVAHRDWAAHGEEFAGAGILVVP